MSEPPPRGRVRLPVQRLMYAREPKKQREVAEVDAFKCALVAPHRTRTKSAAHA